MKDTNKVVVDELAANGAHATAKPATYAAPEATANATNGATSATNATINEEMFIEIVHQTSQSRILVMDDRDNKDLIDQLADRFGAYRKAFKRCDLDRTGFLNKEELLSVSKGTLVCDSSASLSFPFISLHILSCPFMSIDRNVALEI